MYGQCGKKAEFAFFFFPAIKTQLIQASEWVTAVALSTIGITIQKGEGLQEIVCCPCRQKLITFVKRSLPFQKY